jgi:hypothetical protein
MASATELGEAGLKGWRAAVGDAVAEPVAKRTPLDDDQVRAAIGALFFLLALTYVVRAIADASRRVRQSR